MMQVYTEPTVEVLKFSCTDIITASNDDVANPKDDWWNAV